MSFEGLQGVIKGSEGAFGGLYWGNFEGVWWDLWRSLMSSEGLRGAPRGHFCRVLKE